MHGSSIKVLAAALLLAAAGVAHAGLTGAQVTLRYDFGGASSTDLLTVGNLPEVTCTGDNQGNANVCAFLNQSGSTQVVDIADASLSYGLAGVGTTFTDIAPNSFTFSGLAAGGAVIGVQLTQSFAGLDASRISFTADSVRVDMQGLSVAPGQGWTLAIQTVPEPGAAALLLAGLAMLAWRRR